MSINEMDEFVEYSKEKFKRDVEKWGSDKNIKLRIAEDWGEYSFWSFFTKGTNCLVDGDDNTISIIDNKFNLDLLDEDYEIYINRDEINKYWIGTFGYPTYWIHIKDNNKPNITIEIL